MTTKDDAVAEIMKYAFADERKAAKPKTEKAAKKFKAKEITLPAGCKWFSDVFGWKPEFLPRDIPVRIFDDADWSELIRPYIPAELPNGGLWTWPKKATEFLALAMHTQDRTLVHGPTGSGKSALVQAFAHMVRVPLIRVNCHGEQQSTDFLGADIITTDEKGASVLKYDWSLTTIAAKHGGLLLLDEAFRSPVLMSIQALLERGGSLTLPAAASLSTEERHIVPPRDRFWIVLTDNTNGTGDESGSYNAEVQDLSTLGRITATIEVPYMTPEEQVALLKTSHPDVPEPTLKDLADWADQMRKAFAAKSIMQPICMRAILSILNKYEVTGSLALSISVAYVSKLSTADKAVAAEAFQQVTGEALEAA
jgi:cobaltochelatase CobS